VDPFSDALTNVERQAQALMKGAEVINAAQQEYGCMQGVGLASQAEGATEVSIKWGLSLTY